MSKIFNITLDGPGGSGKSTLAKALSKILNIAYLDTGAMYRGVAYFMQSNNIDVSDVESVKDVLPNINMQIINGETQQVIVNGENITDKIRTQAISMGASTVSKIPEVRLKLVEMQREIASNTSCVIDGRDIGSYVLPNAEYKFYITADIDERARRRFLELELKGTKDITFESVKTEMIARDEQDTKRDFAPLVVPTGAYVIDTTNLTVEEVLEIILDKINK